MFEKICCIYDSDEQYVVKLMEAMNESMDFPYKVLAYTSESALTECSRKYEVEILITDEDINANLLSDIKAKYLFHLCEQSSNPDERKICRYQSVEGIIKELLAGLTDGGVVIKKDSIKTTAVYSPVNQGLKTTLALGYVLQKAKSERILYINLDEFATLKEIFETSRMDMSDALFYYVSNEENRMGKIISCINNKYGFDYISPVSNPEDISFINSEILLGVISEIAGSGIYKEIVIDIGNLISNPWEIMCKCDQVLMPQPIDELSTEKVNLFFNYIKNSKYRNIVNILRKIQIGYNNELSGKCITMSHLSNLEMERGLQEFIYG